MRRFLPSATVFMNSHAGGESAVENNSPRVVPQTLSRDTAL